LFFSVEIRVFVFRVWVPSLLELQWRFGHNLVSFRNMRLGSTQEQPLHLFWFWGNPRKNKTAKGTSGNGDEKRTLISPRGGGSRVHDHPGRHVWIDFERPEIKEKLLWIAPSPRKDTLRAKLNSGGALGRKARPNDWQSSYRAGEKLKLCNLGGKMTSIKAKRR